MRSLCLPILAACLASLMPAALAQTPSETPAERDKRMGWFRDARFGLFIHWGLYAIPAGEWQGKQTGGTGEWIMTNAQIPVPDYEPLLAQFNPVKFNALQWVKLAKRAGMKYVIITSKHHDGFCLFDAKNSDWDVMSTPFKRDILKELAVACKAEGMRLCFYHSIMDWHEPDYLPRRPWDKRPADPASFPAYIEYMKAQLKQLVKEYGPLGIMWFDGEWESTWTHDMGKELYSYVRSLQPSIIVNNRVDKGRQGMQGLNKEGDFAGDYGTPEQEVPATGLPGVDWESCITMNDTWGFRKNDTNWKSAPDLIRMLVDVASKGGNLLLNVGPTAEGLIPEASVERLEAMGAWMRKNAESIHGTTASPIGRPDWGRATKKGSKVYLHVFNWPADGRIVVKGLPAFIKRASLLAGHGTTLQVLRTGGDVTLVGPTTAPDAVDTVVLLETQ